MSKPIFLTPEQMDILANQPQEKIKTVPSKSQLKFLAAMWFSMRSWVTKMGRQIRKDNQNPSTLEQIKKKQ